MNEVAQIEEIKTLLEESPKGKKRKLLTSLDNCWAKCQVCKEAGNLENLIRQGIPIKSSVGLVIHGAFRYVYFCTESCQGLFNN